MIENNLKFEQKIKKIENILETEENLEKYINEIDNIELNIPNEVSIKLMKTFNLNERKQNDTIKSNNDSKNVTKFYEILKVAACTIFALIIWETSLSGNISAYEKSDKHDNKLSQIYDNFDTKVKDINNVLMTPMSVTRGK